MSIKLFTSHCPKCRVIETKLKQKNIEYTEETNLQEVIDAGFKSVPILKVDDKYYKFEDANRLIMNM